MSVNLPNFSQFLTEAYKFAALQANKKALSESEKKQASALWSGPGTGHTPFAIWKSKDAQGNTVFVANTHKAYVVERTLTSTIRKLRGLVEGTS